MTKLGQSNLLYNTPRNVRPGLRGSRITAVLLWTAILCLGWQLGTGFQAGSARAEDAPPSNEQIEDWVSQLESDAFLTRETAMLALIKVGSRSIEPLSRVLQNASPETSNRGVHVLQQLIRDPSPLVQDQAYAALEELAAHTNPSVSRRAKLAMSSSAELLSERAVSELSRLGARFSQSPFFFFGNGGVTPQLNLELGDGWTGTNEDLRHLRRLYFVAEATLSGPKVTDAWLDALSNAPNLNRLRVTRGSISKHGLGKLKNMRQLQQLSLTRMPLEDDILEELVGFRAVNRLDVFGTRVTRAAADRFKEAMPQIAFDFRSVFLGVTSPTQGANCLISSVEPQTPAASSGMKAGDIITKFNGTLVPDFEVLRALIAKHLPGDKVEVEVLRDRATIKLIVLFE